MPLRVSRPGPLLRLACLGGGGPVPVPPYLAWGCGGGGRASPGGVPSTVARGVWGKALPLPRLPANWAGCWGPRSTCCGRGRAGVGALLCPLGLHALWGLRAAGRVRGVRVPGAGRGGACRAGGRSASFRPSAFPGQTTKSVSVASCCPWGAWPPIPLRFVLTRLVWARSVRRPGALARARLFSAAPVGAGGWGGGAGRAPAPLSGGGGTIPPASGDGGRGPCGLRAGGGVGGGSHRSGSPPPRSQGDAPPPPQKGPRRGGGGCGWTCSRRGRGRGASPRQRAGATRATEQYGGRAPRPSVTTAHSGRAEGGFRSAGTPGGAVHGPPLTPPHPGAALRPRPHAHAGRECADDTRGGRIEYRRPPPRRGAGRPRRDPPRPARGRRGREPGRGGSPPLPPPPRRTDPSAADRTASDARGRPASPTARVYPTPPPPPPPHPPQLGLIRPLRLRRPGRRRSAVGRQQAGRVGACLGRGAPAPRVQRPLRGGCGAAVSSVRLRPLLALSWRGGGSGGGPLVPWRRLLTAGGGGGAAWRSRPRGPAIGWGVAPFPRPPLPSAGPPCRPSLGPLIPPAVVARRWPAGGGREG